MGENDVTLRYLKDIETAFNAGETAGRPWSLSVTGNGSLPSWFAVSDFAAATVGAAGLMLVKYAADNGDAPSVTVDRRYASLWFGMTLHPEGWEMPATWDAVAGDYLAKDGWVRLHTNAPHHRAVALSVLGADGNRDAVAKAVAGWEASQLEAEVVAGGGCAASMRGLDAWASHPQGEAVSKEPLVAWTAHDAIEARTDAIDPARPLDGIRVLDLTRVLAGPVASRFLAGYGADVLRIDPPTWSEPGVIPEVTLGKRCAGLDLRDPKDRETFEALLASADVLVHGYRAGALPGLGYGPEERRALNPGLVDVSLNAYGATGPWAGRRGFDSLVQMSSGIANHSMEKAGAEKPVPLPVQALDHGTGYLLAAAILHALHARRQGRVLSARLSLARTAVLLTKAQTEAVSDTKIVDNTEDLAPEIENTDWGPARRTRFPLAIDGIKAGWRFPASELQTASPDWLTAGA